LRIFDKIFIDDDPLISSGNWKLVPFIRILQWLIIGKEERDLFHEEKCEEKFLDIFGKVDSNRMECDVNKHELLKFWDVITEDHVDITREFSNTSSIGIIFDFFISLRPRQQKYIEYNNDSLIYFYKVVKKCCEVNSVFLDKWMNNDNFLWAVRYLLVESQSYTKVGPVLQDTLDLCFRHKIQYKKVFIDKLIEFGFSHLADNFFIILGITKKLLSEREEKIHFCQVNGLTNLITAFSLYNDWNPDMIKLLLETVLLAVNWFLDNMTDAEVELRKKYN